MYNIKVDVKLSPRGKQLLDKEEYTCALSITDADVGQNLQAKKNYVMDKFVHDVMPEGMFIPETFQVFLIGFTLKEKEWLSVEIHVNGCTTIYVPVEVYFGEDDPEGKLWFHLRPINEYNYESYNTSLCAGAFTNRSFRSIDKITRYKFSTTDLKPINGNAKIDLAAHPMGTAAVQMVIEQIKYGQSYALAQEKIIELTEKLHNFDTRKLNDLIEIIDGLIDDEYDGFGL